MTDRMHQPRDDNGQFVSLRDYVERIFSERQKAHESEHELIDKALDKAQELREEAIRQARTVVDSRLEKLNELRAEVQEDRGSYATRDAVDVRLKPVEAVVAQAVTKEALDTRLKPLEQDAGSYLTTETFETYKKEQTAARRANTAWLLTLAVSIAGLAIALFAK